jgi:hypothetical protein
MKKKYLILFGLFISLNFVRVSGQDYIDALGFRGGYPLGITYKHFIGDNSALEGILSTRWRGFNLTALYELHANAFKVDGLNWYFGGGAHIGHWAYYDGIKWLDAGESATVLGVDGILGIEYNIKEFPLNLSLDWKPTMNLIGYSGFWGDEVAISVRYRFN